MIAFLRTVCVVVLTTVALAGPALAQTVARVDDPSALFIASLGDKAVMSLTGEEMTDSERQDHFRTLLSDHFDIRTIGRFVLGRYWRVATPEQKDEYFKLFEDMLVQAYSGRFSEYSGEVFEVLSVQPQTRTDTVIKSRLVPEEAPSVSIDWRVRKKEGEDFQIIDVSVENVSMSITQRSEFSSIIVRGGGQVDALLKVMRDRVAQNTQENAQDSENQPG